MSKISDANARLYREKKRAEARHTAETVQNFMAGESYTCDPLTTMKLITASSIFGEPAYYRAGMKKSGVYAVNHLVGDASVIPEDFCGKTTDQVMASAIDRALSYDFQSTLNWAVELRRKYNMRLNPQVIMVRAAIHPDRKAFTASHPGEFDRINRLVMQRADDPLSQLSYYIWQNGGNKNCIPSILKRSVAARLSSLTPYQVAKYKNHDLGMKNAAFITHAFSPALDELIKTGNVRLQENERTWENLRSEGKSWREIFRQADMGHMALLRNLRGVFTEVDDVAFCREYLDKLRGGVAAGKQFPFRYWSARNAVYGSECNHKPLILDALEECMDLAKNNLPYITGKTMVLSDNSGSAWGTINSEYGSVTVAEIDNLSAVLTASLSDEGYVGVFGDRLYEIPISKRDGILTQTERVGQQGQKVGGATENGIWLFFKDAIDNHIHWDNIVIYSDQQAGHGGLYGTPKSAYEYKLRGFSCGRNFGAPYINVLDLILEYRQLVNPKVNVMSVQTAGYDNVLIPENIYRGTIAYGWTGQEALLLKATADIWDELEQG